MVHDDGGIVDEHKKKFMANIRNNCEKLNRDDKQNFQRKRAKKTHKQNGAEEDFARLTLQIFS